MRFGFSRRLEQSAGEEAKFLQRREPREQLEQPERDEQGKRGDDRRQDEHALVVERALLLGTQQDFLLSVPDEQGGLPIPIAHWGCERVETAPLFPAHVFESSGVGSPFDALRGSHRSSG